MKQSTEQAITPRLNQPVMIGNYSIPKYVFLIVGLIMLMVWSRKERKFTKISDSMFFLIILGFIIFGVV